MFGVDASQDKPISVHAQTVRLTPDISPRGKSCVIERMQTMPRRSTRRDIDTSVIPTFLRALPESQPVWRDSKDSMGIHAPESLAPVIASSRGRRQNSSTL